MFIPWPLWPMLKHCRPDILARGHLSLLHRQRPAWSRIHRGWHFECEPVGHQLCRGTQQWPARPWSLLDRRFCLGSSVSASAPPAPVMISISFGTRSCPGSDPRGRRNSPQFPRFRRQPGHLHSPPHYLPHRTVPDSSSSFYSSNFWSNPTTFVGSPSLPRKEYPGTKDPRSWAPNCSGEGGRRMTQTCLYDFYYEHKTLLLVGGLSIPTVDLFPHNESTLLQI